MEVNLWAIIPAVILGFFLIAFFIILQRQPTQPANLMIKVKPVPFLPLLTILINTQLMLRLQWETWTRFIVWLLIGLLIYFSYGIRHSTERKSKATN